jgi:MoaA/NifB/PqqE/SkfB family radical SAM enzyme
LQAHIDYSSYKKIVPRIPVVFKGTFPKNFVNDVRGWGSYSKEILESNFGKLLSLDIDFGDFCSLNCPHCFRRNNAVNAHETRSMSYDDLIKILREGKKLGLRSVKFLGAGEPFEDKSFLGVLRDLHKMEIVSSIFTKGHVIGDNNRVRRYNSDYGISTGKGLVKALKDVGASILLGFNSFYPEIQDKMVGNVEGYTLLRNRALKLLVEEGFNDIKENPTRLCLATNPVTNDNYKEIYEIYTWARVRNIYVIVCPTMISGRCAEERDWRRINPPDEQLIDLYTKIYKFNLGKGIQTMSQIEAEGISSYAGGHPCNQVACGMYLTLTGTVLRCPGDDTTRLGSVWKNEEIDKGSLRRIWLNSENYGRSGTLGAFNCGCPPKWGKSIPHNLFTEVMLRLKKYEKTKGKPS